jgi:hypothetical protein
MKAMLGDRGCRLGSDQYQAAEQAAVNQSIYWPARALLRTISFIHEFHKKRKRNVDNPGNHINFMRICNGFGSLEPIAQALFF